MSDTAAAVILKIFLPLANLNQSRNAQGFPEIHIPAKPNIHAAIANTAAPQKASS